MPPKFVGTFSDPNFDLNLADLLRAYPGAKINQFKVIDNDVFDNVGAARNRLESVLGAKYPDANDIRSVVDNIGTAVENQMGRDPDIKADRSRDEPLVVKRMTELGVPLSLVRGYQELHRYYISKKHADSPNLLSLKSELSSPLGRKIASRFFEVCRRILSWYYTEKSMPQIAALGSFPWETYGITLDSNGLPSIETD